MSDPGWEPLTKCAACHTGRPYGAVCKYCGEPPRRSEPELSETMREWYYSERARGNG